jgi:homoserine kinase type II
VTDALDGDAIAASLARDWGLRSPKIQRHDRGMNSRTWIVSDGTRRWVAKAVPADVQPTFAAGLAVASLVEVAGIPSGAPEPTRTGALSVALGRWILALLGFVDGEPLVGDDEREQRLIGLTLARAHRALIGREVPGAEHFHWIDADAPHLDVEPWVRPAVRAAIGAYDAIPPNTLTWGLLHSDPAPEAFLSDPRTGRCGLIDWGTALIGPLMYDVASAVMYVGGRRHATALLDAYRAERVIPAPEVERTLDPMLQLRWAVQADYFARRLATDDLTGISSPDENQDGLDDARRWLLG